MQSLDEDIVALMTKRVYDLAGVTDARVKVKLNGQFIKCKNFVEYADFYLKNDENKELPKINVAFSPTLLAIMPPTIPVKPEVVKFIRKIAKRNR